MIMWVMNLGFAASGASGGGGPTELSASGMNVVTRRKGVNLRHFQRIALATLAGV